jgi:thioredoxin 1
MGATQATTDANFESDVLKAEVPVLVDFWAEWCGPCKALTPKLEEIAQEFGDKIKVVKLNIDEHPNSPVKYGVRGIPTLILFKAGQEVDQIVGNVPKDNILSVLNRHV